MSWRNPTTAAFGSRALDWSQTPGRRFLAEETRAILSTAVRSLPARYRSVVMLRDIEARASADLVEVLHASEPCLKTRLHRARLMLRERLSPYFSERRRRPG